MVFRPGRWFFRSCFTASSRRQQNLSKWFFPWCFPIWGPDVKVAKIHSSSKRKKEPKASFSMGFRSYVRHFRGAPVPPAAAEAFAAAAAILGLLRPSEVWVFPCREVIFSMVFFHRGISRSSSTSRQGKWCFSIGGSAAAAAKASAVAGGKGSQNS